MREPLERNIWLGRLLGHYGGLLTERQRELLALHVDDDLSLSEIAEGAGISRQGVHDALKRAETQLSQWETQLGLVGRTLRSLEHLAKLERKIAELPEPARAALGEDVRALRQIWEENDGI